MRDIYIISSILIVLVLGYLFLAFDSTVKNDPEESKTRLVKLFYYNPEADKDESGNILCSRKGLVAVERNIPITITPIEDTLRLLIEGNITSQEISQGIHTEFPLEGVEIKSVALDNGELLVEIKDPLNKTSGGACRAGVLWFQIEETAKQFTNVENVSFVPEYLFQP